MSTLSIGEAQLKALLKEAILELVQERKDDLVEILAQVIQDLALARAIEEGKATETVCRKDVFQALEETATTPAEPRLKPLPVLEGYVPEGWKNAG